MGSGASAGTRTAAAARTSTRVAKEDCPKKWVCKGPPSAKRTGEVPSGRNPPRRLRGTHVSHCTGRPVTHCRHSPQKLNETTTWSSSLSV